jgi:hypothetical protein
LNFKVEVHLHLELVLGSPNSQSCRHRATS